MSRTLDDILQPLRNWAEARPDVSAVYLFGSAAEGRARPDSDLDIGLLLVASELKRIRGEQRMGYEPRIASELAGLTEDTAVDVVVLNEAPTALVHRAVFGGRLVWSRDERARIAHATAVQQAYLRAAPLRALRREYLRRRFGEPMHG